MKKLLSILTSMSIIASGSSTVMAIDPATKTNKLTSDETGQNHKNDLKIIDVIRKVDIYLAEVAIVSAIINNFQDLTNVRIQSNNPEIVKATIIQGWVEMTAVEEGTTTVIVTADDAEDAIITVTVERVKKIDVNKTAETYINKTTSLQIRNAWELKEISAESKNQKIATASIVDNMVQIAGINKGTVEIIVSALNGLDVTIAVTVNELGIIELDHDRANVIVGNLTEFKITNFQDLKNVTVISTDPDAVSVAIINDLIFVQAFDLGITNVIVSAENAADKIIAVTVQELFSIEVDKETVTVFETTSEQIKITNFSELENIEVKSNNNAIARATVDNEGVITVQGIRIGTTTLRISADDAKSTFITVTVKEAKWIEIPETAFVYLKGWTSLVIQNFQDLTHVRAVSSNSEVATVAIIYDEVQIYGVKEGIATIKVTADNAIDALVTVVVKEEKLLSVEITTFD